MYDVRIFYRNNSVDGRAIAHFPKCHAGQNFYRKQLQRAIDEGRALKPGTYAVLTQAGLNGNMWVKMFGVVADPTSRLEVTS